MIVRIIRRNAQKFELILAAAMRQNRFIFVIKSTRNDPGIVSASPHKIFLSSHRQTQKAAAFVCRRTQRGTRGLQRIKYASDVCVSPVASFHRTGHVLGFHRCISHTGFSTTSPCAGRHARAYHAGHHAKRHYTHHHHRHTKRLSRWERGVARMQAGGFADTNASFSPDPSLDPNATLTPPGGTMAPAGFGSSSNVVAEARRHLGGNPTGRGSLWCARFANMVLQHSGYRGTGSDMASSFAKYGQRVSGPQVRDRGDDAWPPRRSCRHHHRHRCFRKSDHDLGQQWQPGPRGAGLARTDLRLRRADELAHPRGRSSPLPPSSAARGRKVSVRAR